MSRNGARALSGVVGTGLAIAVAIGPAAQAKTFTVERSAASGRGSLESALAAADRHLGKDRVEFARSVRGTIRVRGQLEIEAPVAIEGPGRNRLTLSGSGKDGSLIVFAPEGKGGEFALRDLSVRGAGITAKTAEGGVDVELDVVRTTLSGRGADATGVYLDGYYGGELKLSGSTVSGFTSGVGVDDGSARIEASAIQGNSEGVFGFKSFTRIHNSTISGNDEFGGASFSYYAGAAITKSAITGNTAVDSDGAGPRRAYGGGVSSPYMSSVRIVNSTVSGNAAVGPASRGGGVYGRVEIEASTITANTAEEGGGLFVDPAFDSGPITVEGSIVAGNSAAAGPDCAGSTPVTSLGHNLFGVACGETQPTDIVGVNPLLGPLADNGGPTRTHALLDGSPAIAAGADIGLKTDQRGERRGNPPDIGSFERR